MSGQQPPLGEREFIRRVLIVLAIVTAAALLLVLRHLLILVFGSVVLAVLLGAISGSIHRWTRLPRGVALGLAVLFLAGIVSAVAAMFGSQVAAQAQQLGDQLTLAWDQMQRRAAQIGLTLPEFGAGGTGRAAAQGEEEGLGQLSEDLLGRMGRVLVGTFGAITDTLLVIAGGIYLAAQPHLYRSGFLKLFPSERRKLVGEAYDHSGKALKLWLLGTLISMTAVGILTGIGLWLLGVPSAIGLGLLAAILEFVPIIGPIAASVPAILIAFTKGPELALWTLALFVGVQQLEGNVIQPIVQRYAVDLPPAILLFSIVAAGFLFGIIGVIFAAPLTVVGYVLVKRLYVQEVLETDTSLPHE